VREMMELENSQMLDAAFKFRFLRILIVFVFFPLFFLGELELWAQYSPGSKVHPKIWSQPENTSEKVKSPVVPPLTIHESEENENLLAEEPELFSEELKGVKSEVSAESPAISQTTPLTEEKKSGFSFDPVTWFSSTGIQGSVSTFLFLSAVSLAPAFLMMTTSFVRIFVVLGILRHGFGTQGIPGTQVLAALALFMTFFIMFPTWEKTWREGIVPYQEGKLSQEEALKAGLKPLRNFMAAQLERTGNTEEILLFWRHSSTPPDESRLEEYSAEDIPLHVLLPSFMLSELKTAFLIGVQILIPMLVVDLLVSSILVSMGMFMLPPTMVSLPFKLLLFVLADGWRLVVEMLLNSF